MNVTILYTSVYVCVHTTISVMYRVVSSLVCPKVSLYASSSAGSSHSSNPARFFSYSSQRARQLSRNSICHLSWSRRRRGQEEEEEEDEEEEGGERRRRREEEEGGGGGGGGGRRRREEEEEGKEEEEEEKKRSES